MNEDTVMIQSLKEWMDKPIPETSEGVKEWLAEIWEYQQRVGDLKGIAELAEIDVLDGDEPKSSNGMYLAAYKAAKAYHSISVDGKPV